MMYCFTREDLPWIDLQHSFCMKLFLDPIVIHRRICEKACKQEDSERERDRCSFACSWRQVMHASSREDSLLTTRCWNAVAAAAVMDALRVWACAAFSPQSSPSHWRMLKLSSNAYKQQSRGRSIDRSIEREIERALSWKDCAASRTRTEATCCLLAASRIRKQKKSLVVFLQLPTLTTVQNAARIRSSARIWELGSWSEAPIDFANSASTPRLHACWLRCEEQSPNRS
jgi:hypothetical protein